MNCTTLQICSATMQAVRAKRPPGYDLAGRCCGFDDGAWLVPVNDDAILQVAAERVRGEDDDGVVGRLLQEWPSEAREVNKTPSLVICASEGGLILGLGVFSKCRVTAILSIHLVCLGLIWSFYHSLRR